MRGRDKAEDTCLHFALLKGPEKRNVSDTSEIGKVCILVKEQANKLLPSVLPIEMIC